ncbi:bifunctional nuclease family protein [Corynebacterium qintianiae]|uniref:bifunctional nuclease family protein n=1 Tax=Corynebacterium qintianiae TaxID=2709392 RepID=UPI0013E9F088|nr:bifunctional nuclease family protein [Corynebacterium qintianiae]
MVDAHLLGVHPIGPEEFLCALFHVEDASRYLTIWLPPVEGARLLARINGWRPSRPHAADALAALITSSGLGAESLELSSYHEGVFRASLTLRDGGEVDLRPSDALALALELEIPVEVDESVVAAASLWIPSDDVERYFEVNAPEFDSEDEQPGASAEVDAEFEELMRRLGVAEDDLDRESEPDVKDGEEEP